MKFKVRWSVTTVVILSLLFIPSTRLAKAQPKDDPEFVVPLICAAVALGVGVVVIIGLKEMCKKIPPADQDPGGPPIEPPVITGAIDGGAIGIIVAIIGGLRDASVVRDISMFNHADANSSNVVSYAKLVWFGVESSTNLINWTTETRATGWVSSVGMFFSYWQNGTNVMNTYSRTGTTNYAPIVIGRTNEAKKFFRMTQ